MQLDPEKSEEEIVDNYREDTLYTHKFKNEAGKYLLLFQEMKIMFLTQLKRNIHTP